MSQIEVLTGISAHKLRIWERRYEFIKPQRTETNIRLYSPYQLTKLLNVAILNRNGYKISKIDKMEDDEIHEIVNNLLSNVSSNNEDEINALILHMLEYDEKEFEIVFQRCVIRRGFLNTITDVIYPFLNQIGILWGTNKIIASQEHFISNLIRQKIISAIDNLPMPQANAPSIALFLLDEEDHEIGLLLSYFIAKNLRWKVYYFGQRVPLYNIKSLAKKINPNAMLTLFTTPKNDAEISRINNTFSEINDIPLLVSGGTFTKTMAEENPQCIYINHPDAFIEFLNKQPVEVN